MVFLWDVKVCFGIKQAEDAVKCILYRWRFNRDIFPSAVAGKLWR